MVRPEPPNAAPRVGPSVVGVMVRAEADVAITAQAATTRIASSVLYICLSLQLSACKAQEMPDSNVLINLWIEDSLAGKASESVSFAVGSYGGRNDTRN